MSSASVSVSIAPASSSSSSSSSAAAAAAAPSALMNEYVRFNKYLNTLEGRDKMYRTFQYAARFVGFYAAQQPAWKDIGGRLTKFSGAVSEGRKLLRILKYVPESLKLRTALLGGDDLVVKTLSAAKSVCTMLYFFNDNMAFLTKSTLFTMNMEVASRRSGFYWFLSIVLQIALDTLAYARLLQKKRSLPAPAPADQVLAIEQKQTALHLNYVRNIADLPVSANAAFGGSLSGGVTGFCGLVSSLVGVYQVYPDK